MSTPRVLIVDDLPTNRLMVKAALADGSYDCGEAENGESALDLLAAGSYDLIILDYLMPGLTGLEVLAAVREQFDETALPVMIVSGNDEGEQAQTFLDAGANDYISKPFDFPLLAARVRTLVGYKRALDELKSLKGD